MLLILCLYALCVYILFIAFAFVALHELLLEERRYLFHEIIFRYTSFYELTIIYSNLIGYLQKFENSIPLPFFPWEDKTMKGYLISNLIFAS